MTFLIRPETLKDLAVLRMVAEERSFTRAASRSGLTQSALSQTVKRVEASLGVKLLARTTRSVAPTPAGERLLATLTPALTEIASTIEAISELHERPRGLVRVTTGRHAAHLVLWPAVAWLRSSYPEVQVEISVDHAYVDIVEGQFDAGIRLGERLENDMVALPIGPPQRMSVVCSPAYRASKGAPAAPADLAGHDCICIRNVSGGVYAWEFDRDGHALTVKVDGGLTLNDHDLMLKAAVQGFGLVQVLETQAEPYVAEGSLVRVLDEWCAPFAGYHLYYPSRRQPTRAFTLLVEALRRVAPRGG